MINVLIVEDSTAIRKILERILRRSRLTIGAIWEASDGLEALKILGTETVNLVLSDINMPNMDGLELITAMAANRAYERIPVIMITTEGSQSFVLKAMQAGAVGYIRKPFNADEVIGKLDSVLEAPLDAK